MYKTKNYPQTVSHTYVYCLYFVRDLRAWIYNVLSNRFLSLFFYLKHAPLYTRLICISIIQLCTYRQNIEACPANRNLPEWVEHDTKSTPDSRFFNDFF